MGDKQVLDSAQVYVVAKRLHIRIGRIVEFDHIVNDGRASCADVFSAKLPCLEARLTAAKCIWKALCSRSSEKMNFHINFTLSYLFELSSYIQENGFPLYNRRLNFDGKLLLHGMIHALHK
ncbi:hypothetical protein D3C73_1400330 [compost metagenome]